MVLTHPPFYVLTSKEESLGGLTVWMEVQLSSNLWLPTKVALKNVMRTWGQIGEPSNMSLQNLTFEPICRESWVLQIRLWPVKWKILSYLFSPVEGTPRALDSNVLSKRGGNGEATLTFYLFHVSGSCERDKIESLCAFVTKQCPPPTTGESEVSQWEWLILSHRRSTSVV